MKIEICWFCTVRGIFIGVAISASSLLIACDNHRGHTATPFNPDSVGVADSTDCGPPGPPCPDVPPGRDGK